jgi:hypothetical protein
METYIRLYSGSEHTYWFHQKQIFYFTRSKLISYAGNRTIDENNHQYVLLEAILMSKLSKTLSAEMKI